jgi:hypothetical protein
MNEKEQGIFTANIDHIQIFGEDLHGLAIQYSDDKDILQENLTRVISNKCLKQAEVAKKSGKREMRYPSIIIRFAISLCLKLGKNKYEFLRQCFYLPNALNL